ncbi:MAG: NADH-quinone oxidoreductase subunit NuoE [Dehalococcoidales bacterium]|nr:NADH-quinone oxidoreductase subunit NuoE [Dehalococcoidales bacterium]
MNEIELKELDAILLHYPERKRDDLIPLLQEVQEKFRYLPEEAIQKIAQYLHIPAANVFGVATFYALFKLAPSGRNIVRVCRGTACHVRGGAQILREIERKLGIKPGQTTEDFEYTLETVSCIGACALAPNITIEKNTLGKMTAKKVAEVFSDRNGIQQ